MDKINFTSKLDTSKKHLKNNIESQVLSCLSIEPKEQLSWISGNVLRVRCPAKINLVLSVGGKRPDGYHMFESLMSSVTLYDEILFKLSDKPFSLVCDNADIPTDSQNLVYRACSLLSGISGKELSLDVELIKRIPSQAGLGGGSSDAAGALIALDKLWNLNQPKSSLMELASMLGSDVSFFLSGPLAICSGRGEQVHPLAIEWEFWALIIKPDISLSTSEVYQYYRVSDGLGFGRCEQVAEMLKESKPSELYEYLSNDLESSAFRVSEELREIRDGVEKILNVPVRISGSGSAMFALFDTQAQAVDALRSILGTSSELHCWVVRNNPW